MIFGLVGLRAKNRFKIDQKRGLMKELQISETDFLVYRAFACICNCGLWRTKPYSENIGKMADCDAGTAPTWRRLSDAKQEDLHVIGWKW